MNKRKTADDITVNKKRKQASNSQHTCAVSPSDQTNSTISWKPYSRISRNYRLVWLNSNNAEINSDVCVNIITKLREAVNDVKTFTSADECIDSITDITEKNVFLILSGRIDQIIIHTIQDILQVNHVYIFCDSTAEYEQCTKQWSKIRGVFTDIILICEALKQAVRECEQNMVSMNFAKTTEVASNRNLDQLDQSFMYTQILKEILLKIDFEEKHMNEFLTYCREQFVDNRSQLENVEKLEREYHNYQPIWWYTYNCFLYPMLNSALRMMEVDIIIKMGFFVRDLHQHIARLHSEQYIGQNHANSFTVYRGQGLSQADFDKLTKVQGGLMSFNNYLSTSLDREVSLAFAESNHYNPDLIGVLFEITIKPTVSSTCYAKVRDASAYQIEEEILFSMHSVFRIGQINRIDGNDRLWQVKLTLTSDNDRELHTLTQSIRADTKRSTGWLSLGSLLIRLGHFDKAEQLYKILFQQTTIENDQAHLYHMLGFIKHNQGEYTGAVKFYQKSIEIKKKALPPNHPLLATSYNNIGLVYESMGEYSKALSYYEQTLEIYEKALPPNHPDLATSYGNIGAVYERMSEYSKALSYFEQAFEIELKALPPNHPDLATSYNNIGLVYKSMGEYSKALSYHEKDLEIRLKALPSNHPDLATSYNNIGSVYESMGEYSKALSYCGKALEIGLKALPSNHPNLQRIQSNIGFIKTLL